MKCRVAATCEEPVAEGRKSCARHLEMRRTYQRNWARRNAERGLCTSCSAPAIPGRTKCAAHANPSYDWNEVKDKRLRKTYGIALNDYLRMHGEQGGVCAICRNPEAVIGSHGEVKSLAVDHDHETGRVRGLLCNNCNRAIGLLGDDPELVLRAAAYLNGLVN